MSLLSTLSPQLIWGLFDEILQVPRPSKKEEQILAYLIAFAKKHNLDYQQDEIGNITIRKAATAGMEGAPGVILQSHVDMVCEKNSDVKFDFEKDAIVPRIDGGWVKATGTTLGADCGIGMAAALAVLIDPEVQHGALECLFTVDEETGLTGAFGLGKGMIGGKYLINLDSEDEGEICIGCAGGIDTLGTLSYTPQRPDGSLIFFTITIKGLLGGHSGDDIEKGRGNSNKLLNRFLMRADKCLGIALAHFDGGNLRNAIPREAHATFGVAPDKEAQLRQIFDEVVAGITEEYGAVERAMEITLEAAVSAKRVMEPAAQRALMQVICGAPCGVLAMSQAMENLVETSTNLASVKMPKEGEVVVTTSQRSSILSARNEAAASVASVLLLGGFACQQSDGYPGWNPNPNSELLSRVKSSYESLFGTTPRVRAIHAGLECGLFLEKFPHLEMISFGPTLRGVHSPDECLEIDTVDKFWRLLVDLLGTLK